MTPEKAKAPVIGPTEAFKVIYQDVNQGIKMKDTRTNELVQACRVLQLFSKAQGDLIKEKYAILPEARRDEICRLGSAMWAEVSALYEEAEAVQRAFSEPAFVAFKAKLLKKPTTRRSKKAQVAS